MGYPLWNGRLVRGWRTVLPAAVSLILTATLSAQPNPVVTTDKGDVVGRRGSVLTYFGIPYAAPPVGRLRWHPPQSAAAWSSPRDAGEAGKACPQVVLAMFPVPGMKPGDVHGDEDCLYLNIYAPASATASSRLPVMVWIHGGAFTVGDGSGYDGRVLAARNGVVVVTLNYRLGALGFLALASLRAEGGGESSGNYGILDQQAALQWVKRNIANFGGDPASVTIAGVSAGGMSVCAQVASPRAAGLFQSAIIQSGFCESPGNSVLLGKAEAQGADYARKLGCSPTDLSCLRKVGTRVLLKTKVPGRRPLSNMVWSPTYQSGVLPLTLPAAFAQGKFNRVPLLVGTNHDEGRLFISVASPTGKPVTVAQYWGATGLLVGVGKARRVLIQYPFRAYGTPALAFATMFTDGVFSCPAMKVDRSLSQFVPIYAFEFNDPQAVTKMKSPGDLPGLGAFHSSSLVYVFQTPIAGVAEPSMFTPAQRRLSDELSAAWINFVKTGDPNAPGTSEWRRFASSNEFVQTAGVTGFQPNMSFASDHRCMLWDDLNIN